MKAVFSFSFLFGFASLPSLEGDGMATAKRMDSFSSFWVNAMRLLLSLPVLVVDAIRFWILVSRSAVQHPVSITPSAHYDIVFGLCT